MEKMVDQLFTILENGAEFEALNSMLTAECEKRMQFLRGQVSVQEYEQVRDTVFSISYFAQKSGFGIGFRTAVRLILECQMDECFK